MTTATAAVVQLLLVAVGFLAIAPLTIWVLRRRARAARSPQAEAEYARAGISLTTHWVHGGRVARGTLEGERFVFALHPRGRYDPPSAVLSTPNAPGVAFEVRREEGLDRASRRIGLTNEVQTGDEEFDREFHLSGDSREFLESLFGDGRARDAVRALFRQGFQLINWQGGRLSVRKPHCTQLLDLEALRAALEQLALIRAVQGEKAPVMKSSLVPSTVQFAWGSGALMIAGWILLWAAATMTRPLSNGLETVLADAWPWFAAAYLALGAVTVLFLRGRPLAHVESLIVLFVVLPSLGFGVFSAAILANQFLDRSSPSEHVTQVAGQRFIVRTRSGWLGYEWIESSRPAPRR